MLIELVTVCVEPGVIREKIEGRKEGTRKRRKGRKQLRMTFRKIKDI